MKTIICSMVLLCTTTIYAQNIGINNNNVTRAKFEVHGVAGTGKTVVLFGGDRGISLHRNYPGIGMNQYFDNSTYGRYLSDGYAAVWQFIHNDQTLAQGLSLNLYPYGSLNAVMPAGIRAWHFTLNNRFQILSVGLGGGSAMLDVGRGTGYDGAVNFLGTNYHTNFYYGPTEDTYIRGGKQVSNLILNDIPGGKVIFGNGTTTVGVNTNYYQPVIPLEVRQISGGLQLSHRDQIDKPWHFRMLTGANANLQLHYKNSKVTEFSYDNGALIPISDVRVKTNIEPMESILEKLLLLRPVSYKMKSANAGHERLIGFIAQDVQKLFPTLISADMPHTQSNTHGLNYTGFLVIAIKGIQEEQTQLNMLDKDLADVDKRLRAIEKKLSQHQP